MRQDRGQQQRQGRQAVGHGVRQQARTEVRRTRGHGHIAAESAELEWDQSFCPSLKNTDGRLLMSEPAHFWN